MRTKLLIMGMLILACMLPAGITSGATSTPAAYKVVTAKVQGLVFFDDAETAASDLAVRLWDVENREFIHQTYTDEFGAFYLPKLDPGKYVITFETLRLELEVTPKYLAFAHQPHDIIVIIPRGTAAMTLPQLSALLIATTITEGAAFYKTEEREPVVSP